jgi:hypothetical protein
VVGVVGFGGVGDDVLFGEPVICVNFSMELGDNSRHSVEIDVAAGIARAMSGDSASARVVAVGVKLSLTVLAAASFELCCFTRWRAEAPAFLVRTDEMRMRGFDFVLGVILPRFPREDFRWSFRVDFRTGEGDGETSDEALALRAEGVPTAATALGAEDRQPTNRTRTHAVEM